MFNSPKYFNLCLAFAHRNLDMVNLMSYDFFGAFDNVTGINSPLYASSKATGQRAIFNTVRSHHFSNYDEHGLVYSANSLFNQLKPTCLACLVCHEARAIDSMVCHECMTYKVIYWWYQFVRGDICRCLRIK